MNLDNCIEVIKIIDKRRLGEISPNEEISNSVIAWIATELDPNFPKEPSKQSNYNPGEFVRQLLDIDHIYIVSLTLCDNPKVAIAILIEAIKKYTPKSILIKHIDLIKKYEYF